MTRVLVVDDSPIMGQLLCDLLDDLVDSVTKISGDFSRLLEPDSLLWSDVDILVQDLNLRSDITGLDILQVVTQHHPHIHAIAWSGAGSPLLDAASRLTPHVVVKPGVDELLTSVTRLA